MEQQFLVFESNILRVSDEKEYQGWSCLWDDISSLNKDFHWKDRMIGQIEMLV